EKLSRLKPQRRQSYTNENCGRRRLVRQRNRAPAAITNNLKGNVMSAPHTAASQVHALTRPQWFATIAGLSGSFVAIGLARFAYPPLLPSLIEQQWFTSSDAVTLGAANFAGYLAGALLGRPVAASLSNRTSLRLFMVMATVAFFACAFPLSTT